MLLGMPEEVLGGNASRRRRDDDWENGRVEGLKRAQLIGELAMENYRN